MNREKVETQTTLETGMMLFDPNFTCYCCEECAREIATEKGYIETPYGWYETDAIDADKHRGIDRPAPWDEWPEIDYPNSCDFCGVYLKCDLTPDGLEYLREYEECGQPFPAWLVAALTE